MKRRSTTAWTGLAAALLACATAACMTPPAPSVSGPCTIATPLTPLEGLPEASGLALSRRTPGVLWALNDSGPPVLTALDASGQPRGRVRLPNARLDDWEDLLAAPCPQGDCLIVADIGDNDRVRPAITLYRVPEPEPGQSQSAPVEAFTLRYPDGAHDAEALFSAGEDLFIATKADEAAVYRVPPLQPGAPLTLERIGTLPIERATGATTSREGDWIVVRTNDRAVVYRTADVRAALAAGNGLRDLDGLTVGLRGLDEPQGEGVVLDGDNLYLVSEGGGGRFSALRCTLPPP